MKSDSSSSTLLNPRTRQRQDRGFLAHEWTPFSRQSISALSFQEDDHSEGQNLNRSRVHAGGLVVKENLDNLSRASVRRVGRGHGLQEIEEGSSEHFRLPESPLCSLLWLMDAFLKKKRKYSFSQEQTGTPT
ncbi:contactin-5 [Tachysurus ichikawai]